MYYDMKPKVSNTLYAFRFSVTLKTITFFSANAIWRNKQKKYFPNNVDSSVTTCVCLDVP